MPRYQEHSFYCIKCGNKGIPLLRDSSHFHEKFHRKKLYCPFCNETINHIEVRSIEEAEKFKEDFKKGVFKDEAAQSIHYVRNTWIG